MENKMLQYKVKQISRIGKALLVMALMMLSGNAIMAQAHHNHEEERGRTTTFTMDLYYGDISFTDTEVTYTDAVLGPQTHTRQSNEVYQINQSNNDGTVATATSHTISVGTPVTYTSNDLDTSYDTPGEVVSVRTVIFLNGVNIHVEHEDRIPIMVNNSADVYIVLMDGTTNTLDIHSPNNSYNISDPLCHNDHAALEKELNSTGYLIITCVHGYDAFDETTHSGGHACVHDGTCGKLYAYGNRARQGLNTPGSSRWCIGGPGIGSVAAGIWKSDHGLRSGEFNTLTRVGTHTRALKNLLIAGGDIYAKGATGNISACGGAGIGTGSGVISGDTHDTYIAYTGAAIENLCITGGYIEAIGGGAPEACIGGVYRGNDVEINISGGTIKAEQRWQKSGDTYNDIGPGIGAGGGGTNAPATGNAVVRISQQYNTVPTNITARGVYGAAIGTGSSGNGASDHLGLACTNIATVEIYGGTIDASTTNVGAGIGTGGLYGRLTEHNGSTGPANITISGGHVTASSTNGADIGTGGVLNEVQDDCNGGLATVVISGGEVDAMTGGIGGGHAILGIGGNANVTVSGSTTEVNAASIGGGNSQKGTGGNATVTVLGGTLDVTGTIGGGNSGSETIDDGIGNGGTATVIIKGGSLLNAAVGGGDTYAANKAGGSAIIRMSGGSFTGSEIGGGNAHHASGGTGGNAFIVITGGALDCKSIGGGDADYGTPGDVADPDLDGIPANDSAGIYIEHASNIISLKTGYIGGGSGAGGAIGKATAYIDAPNATIQGQFILSGTSTNHSYFTMKNGKISNEGLSAYVDPSDPSYASLPYPRKYAQGGAVYMDDTGGTVTIGNTLGSGNPTIQNCTGTYGGAIYMSGGTFIMNRGTIGGTSSTEGKNIATTSGGALYMAGGSFTMKNGSIQYNDANGTDSTDGGGGIYIASGGIVTINGGKITHNTASYDGGGFYVNPGSDKITTINSELAATEISYNTATHDGGGACIMSGTVNISQPANTLRIFGNRTTTTSSGAGLGGGIYQAAGTFNFYGGTIGGTGDDATRNIASRYGGGLFLNGGNFYMRGGEITYNRAEKYDGGGVYIYSGGHAYIYGGNLTHNTANRNGGGICVNPSSSTVTYINSSVAATEISDNSAAKNGGGAYIQKGTLTIEGGVGTTIKHNQATGTASGTDKGFGGGAYVEAGSVTISGSILGDPDMSDSTEEGNIAAVSGGGIYVAAGSATIQGGSSVNGNKANTGSGGGIYAAGTTTASGSSTFNGNTAQVSGGGIYVASGDAEVTSCTFQNNTATTGNGGGLYAAGNTTVTTSTLEENHANAGDGGGVYVASGGTFEIDGGTVSDNTAGGNGGGFYVDPDGSKTITYIKCDSDDIVISGNSAANGGGAYLQSGTLSIPASLGAYTTTIKSNTASASGGGLYVAAGSVELTDAIIGGNATEDGNTAGTSGGGVYAIGSVTATGSTIKHNTATTGNGGGIFASGNTSVTTSTLSNNTATTGDGGGVYVASGGTFQIDGGTVSGNTAGGKGGGFYVDPDGSKTITYIKCDSDDIVISGNSAANGGGAYLQSGTLSIPASSGVYTTTIKSNTASASGGGLYVAAGSVDMNSTTIGGAATADGNTATSGHGGGIYAVGSVTATSSTIQYNKAPNGNGGGIYANASGGSVTVQTNSSIANNSAANGGGVYAQSGSVSVITGSSMSSNSATALGGAIYANGGTVTVNNSDVVSPSYTGNPNLAILTYNSAQYGGAVYANGGTVDICDGTISLNHASMYGGALYITTTGILNLHGSATLTRNHVPTGMRGGAVYLAGIVHAGSDAYISGSESTTDIIKVSDNFACTTAEPETYTIVNTTRNNIYLPAPAIYPDNRDVISVYKNGMKLQPAPGGGGGKAVDPDCSYLGFSVPNNFVPVIYCSDKDYLSDNYDNKRLTSTVFDDAVKYNVYYVQGNASFSEYHIYLTGDTWTKVVQKTSDITDGGDWSAHYNAITNTVEIHTPHELAYLINFVNGLYGAADAYEDATNSYVKVELMADVDMGDNAWFPIGYSQTLDVRHYCGTFNGNGHTIRNLVGNINDDHAMFGTMENGAVVKDLILEDLQYFYGGNTSDLMGGVSKELNGAKISNCSVQATMSAAEGATSIIGGIVGTMTDGTIEDCYVTAEMTGFEMGGLVGRMSGGNIYNSFAYPKITANGDPSIYVGGLVAQMTGGNIENCYAHEQDGSNHGTSTFGWFAGNQTSGTFNYCYAPQIGGPVTYVGAGTVAGTEYGYFTPTGLVSGKYGFSYNGQRVYLADGTTSGTYVNGANGADDNTVLSVTGVGTNAQAGELHGLFVALNNWRNASGHTSHHAWMRTMSSPINADCPIHVKTGKKCVGTPKGVAAIQYGTDVNDMIISYNAFHNSVQGGYIYLNAQPDDAITSIPVGGAETILYIPENMGVLQGTGFTIKACVGVTFDNSKSDPSLWGEAYDWHMFSSALADAPLGVKYNTEGSGYTPAFGDNPPMTSWYQSDDPAVAATYDPDKVGYFPTDTPYGHPHTTDEVGSFDLYCYSEPFAHWINFKRNSNDHWHTMDHYNIHYINEEDVSGNENHFIKGKGYLAAISKTSMLMAEGTLNNGVVHIKTSYTDPGYYYGHDLKGVNLIGNPYQSYLDFDEFVDENSAALSTNAYYILDADKRGYVGYVPGASSSDVAPRFLHPHQGFLVLVNDGANQLTFTNDMRKIESEATGGADPYFRGEHIAYPLVSMTCTDSDGMNDFAIVELGRPETGGGEKLKGMHSGDASIWFHFDETDWYTAFTTPGINEAPLRFRAYEDGVFTLTWHPENAEFSYLHLIDNITGSDVDCLATDKYVFEGRVTDYTSRFRLKFEYSEENGTETESETFAFMMGDELVVNGEGTLQIFDINGKLLRQQTVVGTQTVTAMPQYAAGVYVLRLVNNEQVKVQKMVINK